ncbi:MAG: LysR family transcriptional regulator [Rhodospirillales bacterium]
MSGFSLSRIDLRTLGVFLKVVEHEGISAVALATGTGLSTISRDISALETRLGVRLCERGRGGFRLTEQGQAVYAAARTLMADVRRFEGAVGQLRSAFKDAFEIGLIDHMVGNPASPVCAALAALHREVPELRVSLNVYSDSQIDVMVRERKVDVAFTGQPYDLAPLHYMPAFVEQHRAYVGRRCPRHKEIAARLRAPAADGHPLPFVDRAYGDSLFHPFKARLPLEIVAQGANLESVLTGVRSGLGFGILPLHVARLHDDLIELPQVTEKPLDVPFSLICRRDMLEDRTVATFIRHLRAASTDLGAEAP